MDKQAAISEVMEELTKAEAAFPPFRSFHEGYAILLEEMDELWDVVKRPPNYLDYVRRQEMREEVKQVAAMAVRFMVDLT